MQPPPWLHSSDFFMNVPEHQLRFVYYISTYIFVLISTTMFHKKGLCNDQHHAKAHGNDMNIYFSKLGRVDAEVDCLDGVKGSSDGICVIKIQ